MNTTMNATEKKALEWLHSIGTNKSDIRVNRSIPPIFLRDGRSFVPRRLYGQGMIIFSQEEIEHIKSRENCKILVFPNSDEKPTAIIDTSGLEDGQTIDGIQIHVRKRRSITVHVGYDILNWIDENVKSKRFANKGHAIEYCITKIMEAEG